MLYKTIFAINDDPLSLLVLEEMVAELHDVELRLFKRPTQLYAALLKSDMPSLIIIDVDLIKWNGIDIVERLRLQAPQVATHVLFLGNQSTLDIQNRVSGIRDSAYLCKDNLGSLIEILDTFFEVRGFGFTHPYLMCA